MLKLFHINPKTNRVGSCQARNEKCPFGNSLPHFETKEKALEYNELILKNDYGLFQKFNKNSINEENSKNVKIDKDLVKMRLNLITDDSLKALVFERWKRGGYSKKEAEDEMDKDRPFYVYYTGNQEITLDYNSFSSNHTFSKGACGYLAARIHQATGYPMVVYTEKDGSDLWSGHIAIKIPEEEETYLDITGISSDPSVSYNFKNCQKDIVYSMEELTKVIGENKYNGEHLPRLENFVLSKFSFELLKDNNCLN